MRCKFCNTKIKEPCFDLGSTAVSNDLIIQEKLNHSEKIYPLVFYVCPKCFLAQTEQYQKGYEIFSDDYVYFSSCSSYWLEHSKRYVENVIDKLGLDDQSFVLEIASNDGYLLTNFVEKNIRCLGIEPTRSTALEAMKKGIPTIVDFFNLELADILIKDGHKADLIIANNVLAHVPNINDFIASFKKVLKRNGTITIEAPHLLNLIEENQFDTIYHEHFFYFSVFNLINIFKEHDLSIYDIEELKTHGGSIRLYVTHTNSSIDANSDKRSVHEVLNRELNCGIDSLEYYNNLKTNAFKTKIIALQYLLEKKSNGKKIIAFGAAAKGNTFLNYCGIKKDIIDVVVDETPYKIGRYMPQSKIPIVPFEEIKKLRPDIIVLLPWNHKDEIVEKLVFTREWGCEIVVFIPKLKVLQ
ncbi:class I SAM-dependent methyltransferase [bacterium]|jgi:SAM-dependent methyltransferase|nr:class I SAM-dependent methyltransferase [bacterium]